MNNVRKTIDGDFGKLYDAAQASRLGGAERLREALSLALKGEREHRATGRRLTEGRASYAESALTAARFFVVKWFLDHDGKAITSAYAASMRPDALHAQALREILDREEKNPFAQVAPATAALDYVADVVRS